MRNPNPPRQHDLLDAVLSALDQRLPEPKPQGSKDRPTPNKHRSDIPPSAPSLTLAGLDKSRRPQAGTVCETCPNSVWFASPVEVKCYCRVMYLVTWSSKEAQRITACDGVFLGQASQESPEVQDISEH